METKVAQPQCPTNKTRVHAMRDDTPGTTRPPRSCQVVGDTTVVAAFLRVVKDKDKPKKPQERIFTDFKRS